MLESIKAEELIALPTYKAKPEIGMISTTNYGKIQLVDKTLVDIYELHQQLGHFVPVIPYKYLYLISNEEIKKGYYEKGQLYVVSTGIGASESNPHYEHMGVFGVSEVGTDCLFGNDWVRHTLADCKKVIATNNPDLLSESGSNITALPQSLVEEWVERQNWITT